MNDTNTQQPPLDLAQIQRLLDRWAKFAEEVQEQLRLLAKGRNVQVDPIDRRNRIRELFCEEPAPLPPRIIYTRITADERFAGTPFATIYNDLRVMPDLKRAGRGLWIAVQQNQQKAHPAKNPKGGGIAMIRRAKRAARI